MKIHSLIQNVGWSYGSQLITVAFQFAYAAFTSRVISAEGFGSYAVALTVLGLISLIATGGLGQAISRMVELEGPIVKGLSSYALVLGMTGAGVLYVTAPLWSALWHNTGSLAPTRLLCLNLLIAPLIGLSSGLLRRTSRFKTLAISTVCANLAGMALGAVIVYFHRSASALVASTIASQFILLVIIGTATKGSAFRPGPIKPARQDLQFSINVIASNLLAYLANNIGRWSVSRWVGASALGQWNRADVVSSIPLFQVQTALMQVLYPEFRHDRTQNSRAQAVWPDLFSILSWVVLPASACAGAVVPLLVPILFGPGWHLAASMAGPLVVIAGAQLLATAAGAAAESLGKFKWIWISQLLMIMVQLVGISGTLFYITVWPAVIAMGIVSVSRHWIYLVLFRRCGYIRLTKVVKSYALASMASASLYGAIWVATRSDILSVRIIAFATLVIAIGIAIMHRRRLPPVVIYKKYAAVKSTPNKHESGVTYEGTN